MTDPRSPVLIVEDSPEDYEIISTCLQEAGVRNELVHLSDGPELLSFLDKCREKRGRQPAVVLLDLRLPGMSGHKVLAHLRKDDTYGLVPVVVLSTSRAKSDVNLAYENGANSYLQKPLSLEGFEKLMASFSAYWLETVVPPDPNSRAEF